MKNSSLTTKLIMFFIFSAVVAYFGFQSWNYFTRPDLTTPVYTYCAEHTLTLGGYVVRDEEVIDCTDPLVELVRAEGERVGKGRKLATVYQNASALEAAQTVTTLHAQLEQLEYAQSAARDTETALRLDSEIESDIVTLRASYAAGNYDMLEANASALKTTVLRREFAYRGGADLNERIEELQSQIRSASSAVGSAARVIAAPFAGTYSAVADGWEGVLTPEALDTLTPDAFARLTPAAVNSTVGKLVRGENWYYAALVDDAEAALIGEGKNYKLAISGVDTSLPVRVHSISASQNGRCLLVLAGDRYLSSVTMLRDQNAELILESHTGLRVPKNALRIGENGTTGVYCRIGLQSYFKPVEIIYQGEDYCLVKPGAIDAVRDSDLVFYTLRAGDEVIVSAEDLYNGKVIG